MNELRRSLLCALSLGLACAVFWLAFGTRPPGYQNLHKWYGGCATIFLAVLMPMMAFALRGKLERSAWPIIIGALLGWVAASLAYLIYFGLFGEIFSARGPDIGSIIIVAVAFPPLATLSPLFGALSGAFFVLSRHLMLRSGHAASLSNRA